jgi:hypothetical protein
MMMMTTKKKMPKMDDDYCDVGKGKSQEGKVGQFENVITCPTLTTGEGESQRVLSSRAKLSCMNNEKELYRTC